MEAMKTHGAFSWSELMTGDPAKAAEFYGSLFGWTISATDMPEGKYFVAKVGEIPVAGMMACPDPANKMPPNWSCYVTVDDVDATIARCKVQGAWRHRADAADGRPDSRAYGLHPRCARCELNVITYESPAA